MRNSYAMHPITISISSEKNPSDAPTENHRSRIEDYCDPERRGSTGLTLTVPTIHGEQAKRLTSWAGATQCGAPGTHGANMLTQNPPSQERTMTTVIHLDIRTSLTETKVETGIDPDTPNLTILGEHLTITIVNLSVLVTVTIVNNSVIMIIIIEKVRHIEREETLTCRGIHPDSHLPLVETTIKSPPLHLVTWTQESPEREHQEAHPGAAVGTPSLKHGLVTTRSTSVTVDLRLSSTDKRPL